MKVRLELQKKIKYFFLSEVLRPFVSLLLKTYLDIIKIAKSSLNKTTERLPLDNVLKI